MKDTDMYLKILMNMTELCMSNSDKNKIIEELKDQVNFLVDDKEELHKLLNELKQKHDEKNVNINENI